MVHLANTYFLLAALALTAWWASGEAPCAFGDRGPWGSPSSSGFSPSSSWG